VPEERSDLATTEDNKELVRRLVNEVVNARDFAVLGDIASGAVAEAARQWIGP
jgi:hypothetical protein